jgi:hypothetical protein
MTKIHAAANEYGGLRQRFIRGSHGGDAPLALVWLVR